MAPIGTFWGDIRQRQTKVILSVAALNGLELQLAPFEFGVTNKSPEFLSKFPYGKIPTFENSEGWGLTEGTTIARYMSDLGEKSGLLGSGTKEVALVDQWIHFAEHEIGWPLQGALGLIYNFSGPFTREGLDKQVERLVRALKYLESYLATRPSGYLVSNSLTLADLVLAGVIHSAAGVSLGAAERAQYPLIFAHYAKVTANEKIKQYWSTQDFVEVALNEPKPV
ncbi:glutathione S-transferase C-terminal-like protein [Gyrodon lividus]|nr:glutathione S-transferase C-terminal-like protein [Gyrodon lividus]